MTAAISYESVSSIVETDAHAELRVSGKPNADMQLDLFEDGDPDGCSPYGCRSGEVA
ncbi:hypothetical protein [Mycobacteroides abscessus]|uniref:hypothetical protein n=1 Tax=Mycobacteroides abscessus TaxID=36809 RepID=UPI0009D31080|nr:hypothetical protein [Mycobacteroides abscessus]SKE25194.1 Uncharacterised protein [Mycobacteroides abscessus subsp. massiliense]